MLSHCRPHGEGILKPGQEAEGVILGMGVDGGWKEANPLAGC